MTARIAHDQLRSRVMSAQEAAEHIRPGDDVGMSGFTGAGYPKAVPQALAARIHEHRARGEDFRIGVWTGASTAPELDGALAEADGIELRLPYQSDPVSRAKVNAGAMEYIDVHLSHVAQMAWEGFLGMGESGRTGLTAYTEVLQDGMLDLLENATIHLASATAFSLSPAGIERFLARIDYFRERIILRPQGISNHPEVIRRLGVIASNGMIEADIYGNVNSTHVMGSRIQNGIGGSGDFARNAFVSTFVTPSTAKDGALSCIVPMVSHVDHTEHDVAVIITEQGLADLRGLAPRKRARRIIERCAHPDFQPMLADYLERAEAGAQGRHTPHLLGEAFSWHQRFIDTGSMRLG